MYACKAPLLLPGATPTPAGARPLSAPPARELACPRPQADAMLHFVPLERPTTLDHRTKRNMGVVEVVKFLKGLQAIQVSGQASP